MTLDLKSSDVDFFRRGEWDNPRFWSRLGEKPDVRGLLVQVPEAVGLAHDGVEHHQVGAVLEPQHRLRRAGQRLGPVLLRQRRLAGQELERIW